MRHYAGAIAALIISLRPISSAFAGELYQHYRSNDPNAPNDLCQYRVTENEILQAMNHVAPPVPDGLRYFIDPKLLEREDNNYWRVEETVARGWSAKGISCTAHVSTGLYLASSQLIGIAMSDALARLDIKEIVISTDLDFDLQISRSDFLSVTFTGIHPAFVDLPMDKLRTLLQLKALVASLNDIKHCIQTCHPEPSLVGKERPVMTK